MSKPIGPPVGARVRSGAAGAMYGEMGVVTTGQRSWMKQGYVYIRWDGNVLSSGYPLESEVVERLVLVKSSDG